MNQKTYVFGKILKKYQVPLDEVDDLNVRYEKRKQNLEWAGKKLAGRIESEKQILEFLGETKIWPTLQNYIKDYLISLNNFQLSSDPSPNVKLTNCWINDMVSHEYNPPHTHYDLKGWSCVLFLKIPEIINDATSNHKFRDGQLGFTNIYGIGVEWIEPKIGDYYIFEASHQHCVMPFKSAKKGDVRRSMSFNFCLEEDVK
tara:strand:- start:1885 stop:2487 length:603 start_codon:yes stop_codon:yes gene_type:complete